MDERSACVRRHVAENQTQAEGKYNYIDEDQCGTWNSWIDIWATMSIVAAYVVDSRRCISYLTVELHGSIPVEFRKAIGNRIYGCDDCQLCCPWNRFSQHTVEPDFFARHPLDAPALTDLFRWDEKTFLKNTEGSAIRRIGYQSWLRNIAIALGNAPTSEKIIQVLEEKKRGLVDADNDMVIEHIDWALAEQVDRLQ